MDWSILSAKGNFFISSIGFSLIAIYSFVIIADCRGSQEKDPVIMNSTAR